MLTFRTVSGWLKNRHLIAGLRINPHVEMGNIAEVALVRIWSELSAPEPLRTRAGNV